MSSPASKRLALQRGLWRRYLALLLDGLRVGGEPTPLPLAAPPDDAMAELMRNLHRR